MKIWDRLLREGGQREGETIMSGYPWNAISGRHLAELQRADAGAAAEAREWAEAHEPPHPAVLQRAALAHREVFEMKQAEAQRVSAEASRLEAEARAERAARAQDHRDMLLATGQGTWRTVAQVLEAARGVPPS